MINLVDQLIVVIGGGKVATRKIVSLLTNKPNIVVVSPRISNSLQQLECENKIQWINKSFEPNDVLNAFLVIAATNQSIVNQEVMDSCRANQLKINVSKPTSGNVMMPAILTRGHLQVSVSTNGASPTVAKVIRHDIDRMLEENIEEKLTTLMKKRKRMTRNIYD